MQLGEGACWRHDSACTQAAAGCMSEGGRIVRAKGRGRSLLDCVLRKKRAVCVREDPYGQRGP